MSINKVRPAGMFRPRRIGHVNLFVGDVDRSMKFYNKICGLEIVRTEPAIRAGFLTNGNTHHDIGLVEISTKRIIGRDGHVQPSSGRGHRPGINHIAFEMEHEGELVDAYERAKSGGVEIHNTTDHMISKSVYIHDPDGVLLEFYADSVEDWRAIFNPERLDLVSGPWQPDKRTADTKPYYPTEPEIRRVESAVFHPRRITHVAIVVGNLKESAQFYQEVAGLQEVTDAQNESFVILRGSSGGWDLVLLRATAYLTPGLHHFGFQVPDEQELIASRRRLEEFSIDVEKTIDNEQKASVFVSDPDGFRVEFYSMKRRDAGRPYDAETETELAYLV